MTCPRRRPCSQSLHDRLKSDPVRFRAETVFVAIWRAEGYGPDLELRNCSCNSTLAIPVVS